MNVEKIVSDVIDFVVYVEGFYGKGGIYDMGATDMQIFEATSKYIKEVGFYSEENSLGFSGDSLDREHVRDIMIRDFGLVFPTPNVDDSNLKRVS